MKTIKFFLSSSSELAEERKELADVAMGLTNRMEKEGISIQLVKWEYVDSASSEGRKQDEYNQLLSECERCIVMFWRRVGKYTNEELDEAYTLNQKKLNPKKIYVLFKFAEERELDSYPEVGDLYKNRFLGHDRFPDHFYNIESLKVKFYEYVIEAIKPYIGDRDLITIENGQAKIDGKVYVELSRLDCFSKNEEFQSLEKNIKKTEKLLSKTDKENPEYLEYSRELNELRAKRASMEKSIWNTSLEIARMANEKCSDRLKRAIYLLENGDNRGADALLREEDLRTDLRSNIEKIKVGRAGQEGVRININEYKAKISAIRNDMGDGWMERVIRLYDELINSVRNHIEAEETASLLFEYGLFLCDQKQYHLVEEHWKETLSKYRALAAANPDTYLPYVTMTLNNLGNLHSDTNHYPEAESEYSEALTNYRALAAANPDAYLPDVAMTLNNLGTLHGDTNHYIEAESEFSEALAIRRTLAAVNPDAYLPDVAATLNNLGALHGDTNHYREAGSEFSEALAIRRALAAKTPDAFLPYIATLLNNLGNLYCKTSHYLEAESEYSEALAIRRALAAKNPYAYLPDVAMALNNLGNLHWKTNHYIEAESEFSEALAIRRTLAAANPDAYLPDVAMTLNNLGNLHSITNHYPEAESEYSEALSKYRALAAANPNAYLPDVATILNNLGNLHWKTNHYPESETEYSEALSIRRALAAANPDAYLPDVATILNNLGNLHWKTNHYPESETEYSEALSIRRALSVNNPDAYLPDVAMTLNNLGVLHGDTNHYMEAESEFSEALAIRRTLAAVNPDAYLSDVAMTLNNLGAIHGDINHYMEAESEFYEALSIRRALAVANPDTYLPGVALTKNNLFSLHWNAKHYPKAEVVCQDVLQTYSAIDNAVDISEVLNTKIRLAYCIFYQERTDEAISIIDEVISSDKENPEWYDSKGEFLLSLGRDGDALSMWRQVMKLNPDFGTDSELYKGLKAKGII